MAERTGISWCDSTANLWIGCSKVSPACDHCYADRMMGGLGDEPQAGEGRRFRRVAWGPQGERSYCKQGWSDLRRWQRAAAKNGGLDPELGRRRVVFINSLSDFFDNHRSVIWRPEAWTLFRELSHLVLILVTKRPGFIARELPEFWDEIAPRIRLVTTAENQREADRRIPELLASTKGRACAAVYGASFEPLLEEIELREEWMLPAWGRHLGWGIIGGESGAQARSMPADEGRGLIAQLQAGEAVVHFKQRSEADHPRDFDDPDSFPADLRIREKLPA